MSIKEALTKYQLAFHEPQDLERQWHDHLLRICREIDILVGYTSFEDRKPGPFGRVEKGEMLDNGLRLYEAAHDILKDEREREDEG